MLFRKVGIMSSGLFLPRVGGYNIARIGKDRYFVAVNNGNYGACVMNKAEFDQFIAEQKSKGNVKPPVARNAAFALGGLGVLAVAADFLFAKGKHVKSLLGMYSKKDIARNRVESHVVKRKELTDAAITGDINKLVTEGKLKSGDKVGVFKFADLKGKGVDPKALHLQDNAVVMALEDGSVLKIYDTNALNDGAKSLLQKGTLDVVG